MSEPSLPKRVEQLELKVASLTQEVKDLHMMLDRLALKLEQLRWPVTDPALRRY
jgi:chaperonin cofactor prefoldin